MYSTSILIIDPNRPNPERNQSKPEEKKNSNIQLGPNVQDPNNLDPKETDRKTQCPELAGTVNSSSSSGRYKLSCELL